MKDIVIVAHFTSFTSEGGNNRFNYIAERLNKDEDVQVEFLTSSFSHSKKTQREVVKEDYNVTLLYEPGYKRNISIIRFYSHAMLGRNLTSYLKKRKKPDCIYCAMPSLSVANAVSKYARKNNVRFILDVQDLWPEAFEMVFKVPVIKNICFFPMKCIANKIYASADEIVAVSETYKQRALSVNSKVSVGYSVYLGTDLQYFDEIVKGSTKRKIGGEKFKIVYIGTLGHSYNIKVVIDALQTLYNEGVINLQFVVMGDGPLKEEFEAYARGKHADTVFMGRLSYGDMVRQLYMCDVAVNPIVGGSAASIINKVGDYAAAGLPVVNSQENYEYCELLESFHAGINCRCDSEKDIADAILRLYENDDLRAAMGKNSRRLAEKLFDRDVTYKKIMDLILQ